MSVFNKKVEEINKLLKCSARGD